MKEYLGTSSKNKSIDGKIHSMFIRTNLRVCGTRNIAVQSYAWRRIWTNLSSLLALWSQLVGMCHKSQFEDTKIRPTVRTSDIINIYIKNSHHYHFTKHTPSYMHILHNYWIFLKGSYKTSIGSLACVAYEGPVLVLASFFRSTKE